MTDKCPRCASPRLGDKPFCADCGLDFRTAAAPAAPPAAPAAPAAAPVPAQPQVWAQPPVRVAPTPFWAPAHQTPPTGIPYWDVLDPSLPPSGQLAGRLELMVDSRTGVWAQVRAANGWRGWVDGRALAGKSVGLAGAFGQIGNALDEAVNKISAPATPAAPTPESYWYAAVAAADSGDDANAVAWFLRAIELNPDYYVAATRPASDKGVACWQKAVDQFTERKKAWEQSQGAAAAQAAPPAETAETPET